MDKCLDLHIIRNVCTDLTDFLQGKLSGTYHTFRTKIIPETVCLIVGIVGLCTDVAFDLRADFFCIHKDSRICNDQGVRTDLFQLLKIFPYSLKISVMSQDIHCHINFYTMIMCKFDSLTHIFF